MRKGDTEFIERRSGWLIPIAVFIATAVLSAIVLLYYIGPRPASFIEQRPSPTSSAEPVPLAVGGVKFRIPANYIRYRRARNGGTLNEAALAATLPDFRGYGAKDAKAFLRNATDSPVVYVLLHGEPGDLTERERFQRIYLSYVRDAGNPGPFGLTRYEFRGDSGYGGEDLFAGRLGQWLVAMRCDRLTANDASPSCLRETRLTRHLGLSYRFKRARLSHWREIATGVESLVHSFMRR